MSRDRIVVATALTVVTLLAWAYVLWLSIYMPGMGAGASAYSDGGMANMDMSASSDGMANMDMDGATRVLAPGFRIWAPADFVFMFAMWSVMMVGMMTPSVAPMVLLYAASGRKAAEAGAPFASTGWFFAGYLAVWIGFSGLATCFQWALTSLALLTPMMATASGVFGGILLVAVGLYQWTPLKNTCLRACQSPIGFLMDHGGFRSDTRGAIRLGIAHGAYCLGCCFALMALLFVGGIMNLLWIAGLMILILLEKMIPAGNLVPRTTGALMVATGIGLLVDAT